MKKLILRAVTLITLLAFVFPICANAAELTADKTEMTLGELIEVTVKADDPVELMQFDLKFDNQKYKYEEVKSDLDLTAANVIKDNKDGGTVRVSAFDLNGDKTNLVTLKFRAIDMGENIPSFLIDKNAVIELGEKGEKFKEEEPTIMIDKISKPIIDYPNGNPDNDPEKGGNGGNNLQGGKYVNDEGEVIEQLPQTGNTNKKAVGRFSKLGALSNVIPYALADSDDMVSLKNDVQIEFTTATNPSIGTEDRIKTGDTIDIPNEQGSIINHTFILYGDVNQDGRITTSDALTIHRGKDKDGNELTALQKEAADIKNDGIVDTDDARGVQDFILKTRQTSTGTIITKYPVKTIEQADILAIEDSNDKYTYTNVTVTTLTANNGAKLTQELLEKSTTVTPPKDVSDADKIKISYHIKEDGTEAEIKLYVTGEGLYLVSVVIEGDEETVEDGKIRVNDYNVIVKPNKAITRMEVNGNNGIVVGPVDAEAATIKLYHADYDEAGNMIPGSEKLIEDPAVASDITLQKATNTYLKTIRILNSNKDSIEFNEDGTIKSGAGYPAGYLELTAQGITEEASELLTIKIDNSKYYGNNKRDVNIPLTVTVDPTKRKTGLRINGQEVVPDTSISINIYEGQPSTTSSNPVIEDNNNYYTVIPITYGDGSSIPWEVVTQRGGKTARETVGKVAVLENASQTLSSDMHVIGCVEDGSSYTSTDSGTIAAIGIALTGDAEKLKEGITIYFDKKEGKKIERVKVSLTVNIIPAGGNGIVTYANEEGIEMEEDSVEVLEEQQALGAPVDKDIIEEKQEKQEEITLQPEEGKEGDETKDVESDLNENPKNDKPSSVDDKQIPQTIPEEQDALQNSKQDLPQGLEPKVNQE